MDGGNGVNAYFFRACKSDCNGYKLHQIDRTGSRAYDLIGL